MRDRPARAFAARPFGNGRLTVSVAGVVALVIIIIIIIIISVVSF